MPHLIQHNACISLNPEAEPFCPAQTEISCQGLDMGNLDEIFTKDVDPNISSSALKSIRPKHPRKVIIAHINLIREKF